VRNVGSVVWTSIPQGSTCLDKDLDRARLLENLFCFFLYFETPPKLSEEVEEGKRAASLIFVAVDLD